MSAEYLVLKREPCERCGGEGALPGPNWCGRPIPRYTACPVCCGERWKDEQITLQEALRASGLYAWLSELSSVLSCHVNGVELTHEARSELNQAAGRFALWMEGGGEGRQASKDEARGGSDA